MSNRNCGWRWQWRRRGRLGWIVGGRQVVDGWKVVEVAAAVWLDRGFRGQLQALSDEAVRAWKNHSNVNTDGLGRRACAVWIPQVELPALIEYFLQFVTAIVQPKEGQRGTKRVRRAVA